MKRVGFEGIEIVERFPFPLGRAADYPLFTSDLVDAMYRLIPAEKQGQVAMSVIVTARMPG
jgi:hypothetical protein